MTLLAISISAASHSVTAAEKINADFLLKNGLILDGSGREGVVGDVAVQKDKIVAVGKFQTGKVLQVIDCTGLVITPGYIDLHSHSDFSLTNPKTRANVNFLLQGCTLNVTGNCGAGPVDTGDYFDKLEKGGIGTNVIHLVPQGSVRDQVLGTANREATPAELQKMRELTEKALRDGAWGMSSGLIYVPSSYAKTDELIELAKVVARHQGIYASHIRGEGLELLTAVNEALEIGKQAELPVHISHFKSSGPEAWGLVRQAAEIIEQARKTGQMVTADQYPYTASSTSLEAMLIPTAFRAGGSKQLIAKIADKEQGPRLRAAIEKNLEKRGDVDAPIKIASYSPRPDWVGKSLTEIAKMEKKSVVDIVLEITRNGGARAVNFGMSEDDVRHVMQIPWVATASDGRASLPDADRPHPRSYGTFARKIGVYALQEQVVSLAQAVRSSSGLPADILRLEDRGYLKPGLVADIAVFDPKIFRDQATYEHPHRYAVGMRYVFVNGQPAVNEGIPTGNLAGKPLRHASPAAGAKGGK